MGPDTDVVLEDAHKSNDVASLTVSEALAELRNAISDPGKHSLDESSVAKARRRVANSIACLRAAVAASRAWGPGAERVVHVVDDAAQSAKHLREVTDALATCRNFALQKDPFAPLHAVVLQHVKASAEAAGAQAVEGLPEDAGSAGPAPQESGPDAVPGPLLTVYGKSFLADFQFYPHDVVVHFRHLTADGQEIRDPQVDTDFARLVRAEDFSSLQKAFRTLVEQENLDASLGFSVRLKESIRSFEDDLLAIQGAELSAASGATSDDLRDRGHGSIRRSAHGLRIGFRKEHDVLLDVEDAVLPREIVASTTRPTVVQRTDPSNLSTLPAEVQFQSPPQLITVAAQYVLILERPLIASTAFALELERISGAASKEATTVAAAAAAAGAAATAAALSDSSVVTDPAAVIGRLGRYGNSEPSNPGKPMSPTMECLLVPSVFQDIKKGHSTPIEATGDRQAQKRHRIEILSGGTEIVVSAAVPNGKHIKFSYSRDDCSSGVVIHRVPVTHPQDVHHVLKLLRQQLVFNALFSSCFANATNVGASAEVEFDQPVEVVVCDPPSFMHFGLFDPVEDAVVGVAVAVGPDGAVSARIRPTRGYPHPCSDLKATALFRLAYNVPLALHGIMAIARRARGGIGLASAAMEIAATQISIGAELLVPQ